MLESREYCKECEGCGIIEQKMQTGMNLLEERVSELYGVNHSLSVLERK